MRPELAMALAIGSDPSATQQIMQKFVADCRYEILSLGSIGDTPWLPSLRVMGELAESAQGVH